MRDALQFRTHTTAELQDRLEGTRIKIFLPGRYECRHAQRTDTRNLSALHCKLDRACTLIARDEADFRTQQVTQRKRMLGDRARSPGCAKQRLSLKQIRETINTG